MTVIRARFVALSAAMLIPRFADGQLTSRIEAGGLHTDASGQAAIPTNIWRVAPVVGMRSARGSISLASSAWYENQSWQLVDGSIGGTLVAPTIYGVRAELIGNASRAYDDRALGADQVDVGTRISFMFNRTSGAWFGGGVARPWRVAVSSTIDLLNAGAWLDVGRATFTATGTTLSLTKMGGGSSGNLAAIDACSAPEALSISLSGAPSPSAALVQEGSCNRRATVTDLTLAGRWNLDRFELAGEAGHRVGKVADVASDSRVWSSGTVTMWVAPRAAFVMGGGRQPSNPARGIPARTFGTIGMMLAYAPTKSVPVMEMNVARIALFETKPADGGMQKIVVRVARVETVDVMGDFTDWSPLSMVRRGRDLWELTVPLSAGRHQINIRTDGGKWVAPPGLPKTHDLFSGEVGVLIVK
jgi:hypothetical protein